MTVDEGKLAQAFREAAGRPPPATFDESDIARQSRRVTVRRRMRWAGGSVAAAAVLVTGVAVGDGMPSDPALAPQAAPPASNATPAPQARSGGAVTMDSGGTSSCSDAVLRGELAAALPSSASSQPAPQPACAAGTRAAALSVRDGADDGTIVATVSPAGAAASQELHEGTQRHPDGSVSASTRARSGKVLTVLSTPHPGSTAPRSATLPDIVRQLAVRH